MKHNLRINRMQRKTWERRKKFKHRRNNRKITIYLTIRMSLSLTKVKLRRREVKKAIKSVQQPRIVQAQSKVRTAKKFLILNNYLMKWSRKRSQKFLLNKIKKKILWKRLRDRFLKIQLYDNLSNILKRILYMNALSLFGIQLPQNFFLYFSKVS